MRPVHTGALTLAAIALGACEPDPIDTGVRNPCRAQCEGAFGDHVLVKLHSSLLPSPVSIEYNPCQDAEALPDGAPVVVVLQGGFKAIASPVERDERVVETRTGMVALYPSFPTDAGDFVSGMVGDYRGSGARLATAVALEWAAGTSSDEEGCTLQDRIPAQLSQQPPWLVGQSNGGNLAVGLLADDSIELGEISGVVTFETPASAQFVTLEVGSITAPSPLYQDGSCSWSETEGLDCPMDYDLLGWDNDATNEDGHRGVAYFDLDKDGSFDEASDDAVWGIRPEVDDSRQVVYSPPMSQALRDRQLGPPELLPQDDIVAFWAYRDASRAAPGAMERWSELPFVVIGTEQDHSLGVGDHAHVSGLAHALRESGSSWVRVNPDLAYLRAVTELELEWTDNPANLDIEPGDEGLSMLPEEGELGVHTRDYVTAGLLELMHRRWHDTWQDDLDSTLEP